MSLPVSDAIALDEAELKESFVRASGPGGQHVNKASTAVELRFDVRNSPSLPDPVKARLERLAGARLTGEGVIVITADAHRSQQMNREAARERLFELIRRAAIAPKRRKPTRPTLASKKRRLDGKSIRSGLKRLRSKPVSHD